MIKAALNVNRKTKSFLNKIWKMFTGKWKLIETEGKENFLKVEIKIGHDFFIFALMLNKL